VPLSTTPINIYQQVIPATALKKPLTELLPVKIENSGASIILKHLSPTNGNKISPKVSKMSKFLEEKDERRNSILYMPI